MAQPHVFLSHSSKNIAFTRQLESDLRTAGAVVYRVSADEGGDFKRRIDEALQQCQWVVLVLTTDALASPWVQQEIYAANRLRHDGRVNEILPIQASAIDARAIPPLWGVYNIFDATRDYQTARDDLLRALGLAIPIASAPKSAPPSAPGASLETWVVRQLASLGFAGYRNGDVEYIVPPMVSVPAGAFQMGSDTKRDRGAFDDEKPQQHVWLDGFQMGKFPVTVAEYAMFFFTGRHGAPESVDNTLTWQMQLNQRWDHPVVNVRWFDAIAYARWLAEQTGQAWRLPTEAEWEKAARGTDGRFYPWGDRFDKSRANTSTSGKGMTTPVGTYASGASTYGAQDMAGNVWEWTSSVFKPYPFTPTGDGGDVVVRGGSWASDPRQARAACRLGVPSGSLNAFAGFRVVLAVPHA